MREEDWNICMAMPGKEMIKILKREYRVEYIQEEIRSGILSLEKIEKNIVNSSDGPFIFIMMISIEGIDLLTCVNSLVKTGELELMLKAAKFIANGNYSNKELLIRELTKGFIRARSPYYLYYMARDVKGAPISLISKALKRAKNSDVNFYYIRDLEEATDDSFKREALKKAIENQNYQKILSMIPYILDDDILMLVDGVSKVNKDSEYTTYLYLIANKLYPRLQALEENMSGITDLIIGRLAELVMQTLDYVTMHKFIVRFPEAPYKKLMDKMVEVIIKIGKQEALNRFAQIAALDGDCARYAVHKIIQLQNEELVDLALMYVQDEKLVMILQSAKTVENNDNQRRILQITS